MILSAAALYLAWLSLTWVNPSVFSGFRELIAAKWEISAFQNFGVCRNKTMSAYQHCHHWLQALHCWQLPPALIMER